MIKNLRWWIGGLLFTSTVINYIDRQTLSVLAPFLKDEYHWTNEDYGTILLAFGWLTRSCRWCRAGCWTGWDAARPDLT